MRHFDIPITEGALNCAYEALEPFSRAFRKFTGQSPSELRAQPAWKQWYAKNWPLQSIRSQQGMSQKYNGRVRVLDFPATAVAVLEHRGDPRLVGNTVRDFIGWRKQNDLPPHKSATFNIIYDDPAQVAPADYRLDLCAAFDGEVGENTFGIVKKTIPAGRCAVLRHTGPDEGLAKSVKYLYLEWLPQSGEELRDFPLYFQRVKFFPDVAEVEAVTDIFLPLK
ncbi:AraC family transcriptional regulator [Microbulbifer donghaiensis]|uniref:AraC family transcriptional regulator n=1 Tax=Microbulbifer donghaiensis TaxID=494016 RepID=UPI001F468D3E|nr:GyrI-like domain-containing protein [Microbulbifer donghaiensis]